MRFEWSSFSYRTETSAVLAGRWIIEGDLASYFDTVHHRLSDEGSP